MRLICLAVVLLIGGCALVLLAGSPASASVAVTQVSHGIYTDAQAQHNTEVEPDTFVAGSTIVSAFQVGRVSGGGASNIGWATSTNGGATWTHGYLPGITATGGGTFLQASDASQGRMFGDYIPTSIPAGGNAYPILPIANAPTGSTFDLARYVPNGGLAVTGGTSAATRAQRAVAQAPSVRPTVPRTIH